MTTAALRQIVHVAERSSVSSVSSALKQVTAKGDDWNTINPRHIFRALLRQCTYLPDSSARRYFQDYIVERFRRYNPRPPVPSHRALYLQDVKIRKAQINKARKGLVFLERANSGYIRHLETVLAMTYGRLGKRRRQLLRSLMEGTPPRRELLKNLVPSVRDAKPPFGKKLEALLKAQKQFEAKAKVEVSGRLHTFRRLGPVKPRIPERNSWDRPMPLKRVKNMKEKWYAALLDTIQPPLPKEEWERLRDLAAGTRREVLVQRRDRAGISENKLINIQRAELPSPFRARSPTPDIAASAKEARRSGVLGNPHRLTPRFMRRMWATIFAQCSCITWDEVGMKWTVHWGGHESKQDTLNNHRSLPLDMSLFEGVDERGNIVSTLVKQ
ncbi:hypothetical protein MMC07_001727 [Pseudocyphellaria aurata]|nr:hypothetical protein [Pseudocyphellaria aurata]